MIYPVQRRATKFILGDYTSDYKSRLLALDLLPISYWLELLDLLFILKCLQSPLDNFDTTTHISFISSQTRAGSGLLEPQPVVIFTSIGLPVCGTGWELRILLTRYHRTSPGYQSFSRSGTALCITSILETVAPFMYVVLVHSVFIPVFIPVSPVILLNLFTFSAAPVFWCQSDNILYHFSLSII